LWSPLNTEPWCTVFCRLFDMAPAIGTFLVLIKVSEKAKKMCLPWPRRWAGPCYRIPRYYIHETIRLFLVLFFYFQIWFQFWYAVSLVLILGYGFGENRVKRNIIPAAMLVMGVTVYTVCWCGFFGRKQDGSHAAAQRQKPTDKAKNQNDENNNASLITAFNNNNNPNAGPIATFNNNNKGDDGHTPVKPMYGKTATDQGTTPAYEEDSSEDEMAETNSPRCVTSLPNMNLPSLIKSALGIGGPSTSAAVGTSAKPVDPTNATTVEDLIRGYEVRSRANNNNNTVEDQFSDGE